jgi:hypothetical protein
MAELKNLDEKQRNRLIRRVDWRYLLSNPKPQKSICFGNEILRQAVETISAAMMHPEVVKSEECDLAVSVNPNKKVLQSAFHALHENGELYTEWYLPWVGGATGVRRRLEKAGFTDIICYWAWPPPRFAPPLYWLPIHSTKILQYYISSRPSSPSLMVRLARRVLQSLVRLDLHNYLLIPVCAVARRRATHEVEGFQECINKKIMKQWQISELEKAPSQLTWLLWTPGHRLISKIIAMVFSETEEKPTLVVKIPRSQLAEQALATEANNLAILSDRKKLSPNGFPALLFTSDWHGILAVGEAFINGVPIYTTLNRDNYRELALKVTNWLIDLARGSVPVPRSAWWGRLVGSAIRDFEQSFGPAFRSEELSCIRTVLDNLQDLPLIFEQRDCSPWNILMSDHGDITVLDWESAEPNGLPALDLIYFLTYLAFFIEGAMETGNYLEVYRNASNPESFTGKINNECQEKYCNQTNMKLAELRSLRLLTWLIHSRHEYRRLEEDAAGKPTVTDLRSGFFSQLIQEEVQSYNGA